MASPISGKNGDTPLVVYTTPPDAVTSFDAITFVLHCDGAAAEHHAQVRVEDSAGEIVMVLKDWNVAPTGAAIRYTFGVGLISSACTVADGEAVEHDLVNTILEPKSAIIVSSVTAAGVAISGDSITGCILYADQSLVRATQGTPQPIYFMPGSQAA